MRCPKCHYISFDKQDRCRNCGHSFALTPPATTPDLPVLDEDGGPLMELTLNAGAEPPQATEPGAADPPAVETRGAGGSSRHDEAAAPLADTFTGPADLPLFGPATTGDDPAARSGGPPPRPPLAVRRSAAPTPSNTPGATSAAVSLVGRRGDRSSAGGPASVRAADRFGLAFDASPHAASAADRPLGPGAPRVERPTTPDAPAATSPEVETYVGRRLQAGLIDVALLGSVNLIVVYLTARVAGVAVATVSTMTAGPLFVFLGLIDFGYLMAFLAITGQTIGLMAAGLRIVDAGGQPLTPARSAARSAASMLAAFTAGLLLATVLLDDEARAWHDRLTGTRVVPTR
jgi:uncharacterized RDD family membrane protein YckC